MTPVHPPQITHSGRGVARHRRVPILGVPVSALTMEELLAIIDGWIDRSERHFLCTLDVHALVHSHDAPDVRRIYQSASILAPDGMPIAWLLRRAAQPQAERLCGPDLMPAVIARSQQFGYRHFLYGSNESTLASLTAQLLARFPAAIVVGSYSPPYRDLTASEERDVISRLNAAKPDIIWVGLGAPKQDRWMATYRDQLDAPVLIGVGAAFDFLAGTVRRAPRFVQRSGLEWVYRIVQEPRRLWKRYLYSNFRFALLLLKERWRHRSRDKRGQQAVQLGRQAQLREDHGED